MKPSTQQILHRHLPQGTQVTWADPVTKSLWPRSNQPTIMIADLNDKRRFLCMFTKCCAFILRIGMFISFCSVFTFLCVFSQRPGRLSRYGAGRGRRWTWIGGDENLGFNGGRRGYEDQVAEGKGTQGCASPTKDQLRTKPLGSPTTSPSSVDSTFSVTLAPRVNFHRENGWTTSGRITPPFHKVTGQD